MVLPPNSQGSEDSQEPRVRHQRGNFLSEWYGHRVYPIVASTPASLADQRQSRCPFLSAVTLKDTTCVKPATSTGVCTISSASNGPRQDWLVCPHRALDPALLEDVARRLFQVNPSQDVALISAPTLATEEGREALTRGIADGMRVFVYLRSKLGGEISFSRTERSPEFSFDITMAEVTRGAGGLELGRYGILEVQTMDFHGTYERAVLNLQHALRLHDEQFHRVLQDNGGRWLSERVEGPNIANVFKRTFYQMMLKFHVGAHESSAGCVLALPAAVWDSWQRHLGKPELTPRSDGTMALLRPDASFAGERVPAWIYVFDIIVDATSTPNPIAVQKVIATDAESVAHFATKIAPEAAIGGPHSAANLLLSIRRRLGAFWPVFAPPRHRAR